MFQTHYSYYVKILSMCSLFFAGMLYFTLYCEVRRVAPPLL